MSSLPALDVCDLRKEFVRRDERRRLRSRRRRVCALDDVTLRVERGECVAILGQNGSGKSTFVRLVSTLLLHDGGSAHVFGVDVFRQPRRVQRMVNRVSVEASFFKRLSAAENLGYSARFYGLTPRQTRARIPEILERVGFPPERSGEPMEDLSRGMQQKVSLARALLTAPMLLLLDEPTTGLDPRSKREVQGFVRTIRETHDATVLICTHDMNEAEQLADRVGVLHGGALVCLGETAEIKRRYGAASLEDVFMRLTGVDFDDERGAA